MSEGENRIARRISALLVMVSLVLIMTFSAYVTGHEFHHDCDPEDCPICELISVCENVVKSIGVATVITAIVSLLVRELNIVRKEGTVFTVKSLISDKVRLND